MDVAGTVALVTGGAKRLGRAMVLGLAESGAVPIVHFGRSEDEAEGTVAEARALGVDAVAIGADLADPAAIEGLFEAIERRFGRLDILVNSAARFDRQPIEAIDVESWRRSLEVNVTAPFLCAQAAAGVMRSGAARRKAPALIVNMVDLSGRHPWRDHVQHGVSKAGLMHLTRILARELAPDIRVNAIMPGAILPPPGIDDADPRWTSTAERVPLRRTGSPADVVAALRYLVEADFVTGAIMPVDGGEDLLGPLGH